MNNRRTYALALTLAMTLTMMACSSTPKPVTLPPGAISQADLTSYEVLAGAQAVIESVKTNIGQLPPTAKPVLNRAIQSYNIAEATWQSIHAGKTSDQAALATAIAQLTADVANLITSFTGAK